MVGGGGRLVSQDQRNDHDVHVGLQQTHGGGVAEGMRRNPSALERGTMLQGLLDGSAQTFFHSPAGQRLAQSDSQKPGSQARVEVAPVRVSTLGRWVCAGG